MAIFESFSPVMLMISKSNHEKSWLGMLEESVKHNPSIFWPDRPPKNMRPVFRLKMAIFASFSPPMLIISKTNHKK